MGVIGAHVFLCISMVCTGEFHRVLNVCVCTLHVYVLYQSPSVTILRFPACPILLLVHIREGCGSGSSMNVS